MAKPITAEQRAQLAKKAVALIDATLRVAEVKGIVQAKRAHDKFTQDVILSKYGNVLPSERCFANDPRCAKEKKSPQIGSLKWRGRKK